MVVELSSPLSFFLPSTAHILGVPKRPREQRRPLAVAVARARVEARAVPRVHRVSPAPFQRASQALNRQCPQCPVMSHRLDLPMCLLPVPRRFPVRCHRINPRWSHRLPLNPAIFPHHCQVRCHHHHHRMNPAWNRLCLWSHQQAPPMRPAWNRV